MNRHINRRFIAFIAALGLGVASLSPAPARAENGEITRALAGLVALGIIGAAIAEGSRNSNDNYTVNTQPIQPPLRNSRARAPRADRFVMPARCLREVNAPGTRRGYAQSCLTRHYDFNASLPRSCKVRVDRPGKDFVGYERRCLRARGYNTAAR